MIYVFSAPTSENLLDDVNRPLRTNLSDADGKQTVHTNEPDDDAWLRLKLWLLSPFVSDELL